MMILVCLGNLPEHPRRAATPPALRQTKRRRPRRAKAAPASRPFGHSAEEALNSWPGDFDTAGPDPARPEVPPQTAPNALRTRSRIRVGRQTCRSRHGADLKSAVRVEVLENVGEGRRQPSRLQIQEPKLLCRVAQPCRARIMLMALVQTGRRTLVWNEGHCRTRWFEDRVGCQV